PRFILLSFVILFAGATGTRAQIGNAHPVILFKGSVMTADGKPATVRMSIHETGSKNDDDSDVTTCGIQEITASSANSASGRYALILHPSKKYWLHMEGPFVQSLDTLLEMPKVDHYMQIEQNFMVNWRQAPGGAEPASARKE